ncbi:hypothetical protein BGZ57DRAFT_931411 [Hyaloscypha finlandica]|nr:hypothetical protein BGZ57DRAFT_931411 [Hyaloscypha finlandica]
MAPTPDEQYQQQQPNTSRIDSVADCATMYAVFCTENIPPPILDDFIDQAYEGCFAMVEDGDVGASPCILETANLDSVQHGSRKPARAFESPFLGKTDDEIRVTIKNKTCRVGYTGDDDRILVTDFYATMCIRVPIEMVTISWHEEGLVGTGRVFNRQYIQNGSKETGQGSQ